MMRSFASERFVNNQAAEMHAIFKELVYFLGNVLERYKLVYKT